MKLYQNINWSNFWLNSILVKEGLALGLAWVPFKRKSKVLCPFRTWDSSSVTSLLTFLLPIHHKALFGNGSNKWEEYILWHWSLSSVFFSFLHPVLSYSWEVSSMRTIQKPTISKRKRSSSTNATSIFFTSIMRKNDNMWWYVKIIW